MCRLISAARPAVHFPSGGLRWKTERVIVLRHFARGCSLQSCEVGCVLDIKLGFKDPVRLSWGSPPGSLVPGSGCVGGQGHFTRSLTLSSYKLNSKSKIRANKTVLTTRRLKVQEWHFEETLICTFIYILIKMWPGGYILSLGLNLIFVGKTSLTRKKKKFPQLSISCPDNVSP